ncbi:hypothetical protein OPV22_030187 [Ensete ventricosum]|uniref:Uncharacterized protein n=1 Tax=Ensete ventricosum TaxID=4639 RepID=A0AAV8Q899_ENSVE|nr:hypothetical protein OPV22_030187 [Ensete ventricosum]
MPTMMRRYTGMIGGDVIRAVGRAVGAGAGRVRGPFSAARAGSSARILRVSSSGAASPPSSPAPTFDSASRKGAVSDSHDVFFDGEEWERVGGEDEGLLVDDGVGTLERYVFGTAPSREEADDAISTLQQILLPAVISQVPDDGSQVSDNGSSPHLAEDVIDEITTPGSMHRGYSSESSVECQSDWIEPAIQFYDSNSLKSGGQERVVNALQLYQRNATVQRMVVSLSSDGAVWDAVMNNEVVQELRRSFHEDEAVSSEIGNSDEHADTNTCFLGWILGNAKSKIMEFIDQILKLAHQIFHTHKEMNEKNTAFDDVHHGNEGHDAIILVTYMECGVTFCANSTAKYLFMVRL